MMGLAFIPVLVMILAGQTPPFSLAGRFQAAAIWTTALAIHLMLPYLLRWNSRRAGFHYNKLLFGVLDIHTGLYIIAATLLITQPFVVADVRDDRPFVLITWGLILALHLAITAFIFKRATPSPSEKRKNGADLDSEDQYGNPDGLEESYAPEKAKKRLQ